MRAGMSERDKAAERGTEVHGFIADGVSLERINAEAPELGPYVSSYAQAVIALGLKPVLVERQVFNKTLGYAGSFDLAATLRARNDRLYVVDLKTGKNTYAEHAIQVQQYKDAEFIGEDDKVDEEATRIFKQADGMGILHITADGWEFHDIKPTAELKRAGRDMARLARFFVTNPTIETLEV